MYLHCKTWISNDRRRDFWYVMVFRNTVVPHGEGIEQTGFIDAQERLIFLSKRFVSAQGLDVHLRNRDTVAQCEQETPKISIGSSGFERQWEIFHWRERVAAKLRMDRTRPAVIISCVPTASDASRHNWLSELLHADTGVHPTPWSPCLLVQASRQRTGCSEIAPRLPVLFIGASGLQRICALESDEACCDCFLCAICI